MNKVVYGYFDGQKCFYIGIGTPKRPTIISKSKRSPECYERIQQAKNKNTFHIQLFYTGVTQEFACWIEKILIEQYGRIDLKTGCLTNKSSGGQTSTGWIMSEEHKQAIIRNCKTRKRTEREGEKIAKANRNRKVSYSTRKKMSDSHKGKPIHDQQFKRKLSERTRKPVKTPLGYFESASAASKVHNVNFSTIARRCRNSSNVEYIYI